MEDLDKDNILNKVQKIGLKHYHDFIERMQREEVEEIEAKVQANSITLCSRHSDEALKCSESSVLLC